MTSRLFRIPAATVLGTLLLASSSLAQTHPAAPQSPYGGATVEDIIARVNDQIITRSDYDRAMFREWPCVTVRLARRRDRGVFK